MNHNVKKGIWGILLLTLMSQGYAQLPIEVNSEPLNLSGSVDLRFNGEWSDLCVPRHPTYVKLRPGHIDFYLGSQRLFDPGGGVACDFDETPYTFSVDELYIPVDSVLNAGTVNLNDWLLAPGLLPDPQFTTQTEITLSNRQEQLIYVGFENGRLDILRRSNFSILKTLDFPDILEIKTRRGRYFDITNRFEGKIALGIIDPYLLKFTTNHFVNSNIQGYVVSYEPETLYESNIFFYRGVENGGAILSEIGSAYPLSLKFSLELISGIEKPVSSGEVYLSLLNENELGIYDPVTFDELTRIAVGNLPTKLYAHRNEQWLMVYESGDQSLAIIDVASHSVLGRVSMPEEVEGFIADASLPYFYSWDQSNHFYVIDVKTLQIIRTLNMGGDIVGASVNPEGGEVLVFTNSNSGSKLEVYNTTTFTVEQTHFMNQRIVSVPGFISVPYHMGLNAGAAQAIPVLSKSWLLLLAFGMMIIVCICGREKNERVAIYTL
ncbi:MAG: YncE family protein [bacterium]